MAKLGQLFRKRDTPAPDETGAQGTEARAAQGEVGQLLRQAREESGISLEQIEAQTRIRQKYLLALEEARYDDLPTPGHVHGFLRNYALALGLDIEEVEALYARDRAGHRRFEPRIFHPKNISLIPKRPLLKADLVLAIIIVVLVAALGFLFWRYGWPILQPVLMRTGAAATATPTQTATIPAPTQTRQAAQTRRADPTGTPAATATLIAAAPTSTRASEPTPTATATLDAPLVIATPTPSPTQTPTPTATRSEGVVVQARFVDRVWLQVRLDGQDSPGELFEAGEEREWTAQYTIYIICGNAGGMQVTVNGEDLGLLGERAQVVEKTWGPQGEITPGTEATGTPSPEAEGTATPTPGG
ncbi:MAG: helix-turn-helix domain-containing protein [Anaerolineae bacterium]|nr:helix-turn-helix domain-containing protein [Anaerolineae bacterium]